MYSRHSKNPTPADLLNRSNIFKGHTQYSRQKHWEIQLLTVSELKKIHPRTLLNNNMVDQFCVVMGTNASFQRKCILVVQAPPVLLTASEHKYLTYSYNQQVCIVHSTHFCQLPMYLRYQAEQMWVTQDGNDPKETTLVNLQLNSWSRKTNSIVHSNKTNKKNMLGYF